MNITILFILTLAALILLTLAVAIAWNYAIVREERQRIKRIADRQRSERLMEAIREGGDHE